MEERSEQRTKLNRKEWRRIVKKDRRRRKRQLLAQERDANEERLRAALENNMAYMKFCTDEEKEAKEEETREQEKHAERERLWLEEEVNIHITILQLYTFLARNFLFTFNFLL